METADLLAAGFVAPSELLLNYTFRTMLIGTVLVGSFSGAMGCFLY
ncbi:zinc ABC transporter permease, partial [Brevibacterium paucivorans]